MPRTGQFVAVHLIRDLSDGVPVFHPWSLADKPHAGLIPRFHLPARFHVVGYDVHVELDVGVIGDDGYRLQFGVTALDIRPGPNLAEVKSVPTLPVSTWLELAIAASTDYGVKFPHNYDAVKGVSRGLFAKSHPMLPPGTKGSGKSPRFAVLPFTGEPDVTVARHFVGVAKSGRRPVTDDKLQVILDAHHAAAHGELVPTVQAALERAGYGYEGESNVRKLVKRALAAERLGDLQVTKSKNGKATK